VALCLKQRFNCIILLNYFPKYWDAVWRQAVDCGVAELLQYLTFSLNMGNISGATNLLFLINIFYYFLIFLVEDAEPVLVVMGGFGWGDAD
jgi:hypothetical protein